VRINLRLNLVWLVKIQCNTINQSYKDHPLEKGTLLILGTGRCLKDDLSKCNEPVVDVATVNDAAMYYPGYTKHIFAIHSEMIPHIKAMRAVRKYSSNSFTHTLYMPNRNHFSDFAWDINPFGGTSAMLAVLAGLYMGYDHVILAGVPMDNSGHFWDIAEDEVMVGLDGENIRNFWKMMNDEVFNGRVKSLSGWTRELLGNP